MNLNDKITEGGLTVMDSIQTELTPLTPNLKRFKESDVKLRLYVGTEPNACSWVSWRFMAVMTAGGTSLPLGSSRKSYRRHRECLNILHAKGKFEFEWGIYETSYIALSMIKIREKHPVERSKLFRGDRIIQGRIFNSLNGSSGSNSTSEIGWRKS